MSAPSHTATAEFKVRPSSTRRISNAKVVQND
jgi:hypothetical protein